MRKRHIVIVPLLSLMFLAMGCHKNVATAPVPGSINTLDSWAYRIVADASASIHSVKTWEQCTVANFPPTVTIDGNAEVCDAKAGQFPAQYKPQLNMAITALNTAAAAGKAYHSGASQDTAGLTAAVNQLSTAVTQLVSQIGGKQ